MPTTACSLMMQHHGLQAIGEPTAIGCELLHQSSSIYSSFHPRIGLMAPTRLTFPHTTISSSTRLAIMPFPTVRCSVLLDDRTNRPCGDAPHVRLRPVAASAAIDDARFLRRVSPGLTACTRWSAARCRACSGARGPCSDGVARTVQWRVHDESTDHGWGGVHRIASRRDTPAARLAGRHP